MSENQEENPKITDLEVQAGLVNQGMDPDVALQTAIKIRKQKEAQMGPPVEATKEQYLEELRLLRGKKPVKKEKDDPFSKN